MKRSDIIDILTKKYTGIIDKKKAGLILDLFFDNIIDGLSSGNNTQFRNFGVFYTKNYSAKVIKNPKTKEVIHLKNRKLPAFQSSKYVHNILNHSQGE